MEAHQKRVEKKLEKLKRLGILGHKARKKERLQQKWSANPNRQPQKSSSLTQDVVETFLDTGAFE